MKRFLRRHPWWSALGLGMIVSVLAVAVFVRSRMQGPFRDYRADIEWVSGPAGSDHEPLLAGVSVREITPDPVQYDTWQDVDGDGRFHPDRGDTWEDRNGNGDFDLIWLAGFNINRPAKGVQDPLWVRALAFGHRETVVAVVSVDCVGLTHERIIEARLRLADRIPQLKHLVVTSTHTHNAPDTMGIWSYRPLPSKFNRHYVDRVMDQVCEAAEEAVRNRVPVDAVIATGDLPVAGFVRDSRPPEVFDRTLGVARFVRAGSDETLATLVSWGNHPEAMGGDNPLVSSDFVHFLREAMEKGLEGEGGMAGFGGTCVFLQGPVGGLMTPLGLEVPDRNGKDIHRENGPGKTRALGENLAIRAAALLRGSDAQPMGSHRIVVAARTVFAPIEGTFKIPLMLGLIHPGWYDGKARTEVGVVRVGDLEMLTVPGEIYPEIVDGGVEAPEGGDHRGAPVEVPPLRPAMGGRVRLVLNLANDEIGYIIPRTQWDTEPPFTYGRTKPLYGEVNSGGPDVAAVVHGEGYALIQRVAELAEGR